MLATIILPTLASIVDNQEDFMVLQLKKTAVLEVYTCLEQSTKPKLHLSKSIQSIKSENLAWNQG